MSLRRTVTAYPTLLRIGLAEAVAYRAEFLVWMLTMTLPLVMLAMWSEVAREAPVGRFDQKSFVAYYLGTMLVRQLAGSWVMWELNREIREGTLALRLLRPIHPLASYSAESVASLPLRAAISAPLTLGVLYTMGSHGATRDPLMMLLFVGALAGAWTLSFAISTMIGTLALYVESSQAIFELYLGVFAVLSGYLVPLELFPHSVERFARALPFAYLQAFPVELLTGMTSRRAALRGLGAQWAWAALGLTAMQLLWTRAVRRFAAFGG